MRYSLIVTLMVILSFSCEKNSESGTVEYYWILTKCADPWGTTENDSNKFITSAVREYLTENEIYAFQISFDLVPVHQQLCEACDCRSGKRISVSINPDDKEKIVLLGFQEF